MEPTTTPKTRRIEVRLSDEERELDAHLLDDPLERVYRAGREVAVRAVVVHATDDAAATFYERFGFHGLSAAPRTLMVTLAELRRAGYGR